MPQIKVTRRSPPDPFPRVSSCLNKKIPPRQSGSPRSPRAVAGQAPRTPSSPKTGMPDAYGVAAASPLRTISSPHTLLVPQSTCGEEKFRVKRPKNKIKIKVKIKNKNKNKTEIQGQKKDQGQSPSQKRGETRNLRFLGFPPGTRRAAESNQPPARRFPGVPRPAGWGSACAELRVLAGCGLAWWSGEAGCAGRRPGRSYDRPARPGLCRAGAGAGEAGPVPQGGG